MATEMSSRAYLKDGSKMDFISDKVNVTYDERNQQWVTLFYHNGEKVGQLPNDSYEKVTTEPVEA